MVEGCPSQFKVTRAEAKQTRAPDLPKHTVDKGSTSFTTRITWKQLTTGSHGKKGLYVAYRLTTCEE